MRCTLLTTFILLASVTCQQGFIGAQVESLSTDFCLDAALHKFQKSLVNRSVNLDSLSLAFSPPNRPMSTSFVVCYHFCSRSGNNESGWESCSQLEKWANDLNAGRNVPTDFTKKCAHKFLWNTSPMNLFIQPHLLSTLSLGTFQMDIRDSHLILDQYCEPVINHQIATEQNESSDPLDICHHPPSVLLLLEALTANVS